jgi:uncharacterized delta-60 repeat protein
MRIIILALLFSFGSFLQASLVDQSFNIGSGANGLVEQVLQLPNGKILVCGNFTSFNGVDRGYVARLNNDGSVDTSFHAAPGYWVRHMVPTLEGKLYIGGYFTTVAGTSRNLIARLNEDGSLDTSFNPGTGAEVKIATAIDGNVDPFVFWMELQSDGKLIITGNFRNYNGESSVGLARINPDGSRDTTFKVGSGLDSWGRVIKILPNNQILVGGWFTAYNNHGYNRLVRINPDGSADTGFNPYFGDKTAVYSIALMQDGKVLVSGHSENPEGRFLEEVALLNTDGSVDSTFPGSTNEKTESILVQNNGKIVLGGYFSKVNGADRQNIGRLNSNGTLDDTFNASPNNFVWTVAAADPGKILISGGFTSVDGIAMSGVARLNLPEGAGSDIRPPRLGSPDYTRGAVEVRLNTVQNYQYTLQYCSDVRQQNWISLSPVQGTGSEITLSDPNPRSPRIYRVEVK